MSAKGCAADLSQTFGHENVNASVGQESAKTCRSLVVGNGNNAATPDVPVMQSVLTLTAKLGLTVNIKKGDPKAADWSW